MESSLNNARLVEFRILFSGLQRQCVFHGSVYNSLLSATHFFLETPWGNKKQPRAAVGYKDALERSFYPQWSTRHRTTPQPRCSFFLCPSILPSHGGIHKNKKSPNPHPPFPFHRPLRAMGGVWPRQHLRAPELYPSDLQYRTPGHDDDESNQSLFITSHPFGERKSEKLFHCTRKDKNNKKRRRRRRRKRRKTTKRKRRRQ